jgi:hypothetical protein
VQIGRLVIRLVAAALVGFAAVAGYQLVEGELESEIYRGRLSALEQDLAGLRERYNRVIRKTAVTELLVQDGVLSVNVRAGDGSTLSLPTPYDPSLEIYIDYVVVDGRLWIRRIFDERTAPGDGMLIDPSLGSVDWNDEGAAQGKAAYRALGEGRWVVSVSGDGALGLARARADQPVQLAPPPPIRSWSPVSEEAKASLRELEAAELLQALTRQLVPGE